MTKLQGISIGKGYVLTGDGKKVEKKPNFGLNVSQKIARKNSKRVKAVRRTAG
jgi:hypothetical protein